VGFLLCINHYKLYVDTKFWWYNEHIKREAHMVLYKVNQTVQKLKSRISIFAMVMVMGASGAGLAIAAPSLASAQDNQSFVGNNLDASQCKPGKKVVDVNYKLINDYDSGVHGNAWANDTIHREVSIWNTGDNNFCAIVKDNGTIVTFAGDSPNGTGTVAAGITGEINGGYRTASFQGTFVGNATYATHGNLGTFDLQCTDANNCPGTHPTFLSYFSGSPTWDYAWWGWEYDTCQNGSWINSITTNTGDITGSVPDQHGRCRDDNDRHHHDNDKHHDRGDGQGNRRDQDGPRD
jgi:hypothetical protein